MGREITLADMAEAAHLEKTYFTKKFRRLTGATPMEYVRTARIEKAKDLLSYSDMSITQIAEALGFQSLHHFSNMFFRAVRHVLLDKCVPIVFNRENRYNSFFAAICENRFLEKCPR